MMKRVISSFPLLCVLLLLLLCACRPDYGPAAPADLKDPLDIVFKGAELDFDSEEHTLSVSFEVENNTDYSFYDFWIKLSWMDTEWIPSPDYKYDAPGGDVLASKAYADTEKGLGWAIYHTATLELPYHRSKDVIMRELAEITITVGWDGGEQSITVPVTWDNE